MAANAHALNFYGLISKERAEKFDLLGQLILNQREAIIVCGATGIGKTTLLKTFKKQREAIWAICLLQGLETLSFEQIQTQLIATIQQYNPELANHDLNSALRFCEQQQQKAVLIIDDAVYLAAGLMTALTEYALHNPVLRLVFVFTREQLQQKNKVDRVVDDCYFMEIPPLTKSQLALFLQNESLFLNAHHQSWEGQDKLLNRLFQRTGGIPGKIQPEFSLLVAAEQQTILNPALNITLIVGIIAMSATYFWIRQTTHQPSSANVPAVLKTLPPKPLKLATKTIVPPSAPQVLPVVVPQNTKPALALEKTAGPPLTISTRQLDADEQWILQQTTGKYTLQLMALPKRQSLEKLVKNHAHLHPSLKILQINNSAQKNYVLLYGSFANSKAAYAAVSELPREFRQAWPRQIKALQHEIKNRPPLFPPSTPLPLTQ